MREPLVAGDVVGERAAFERVARCNVAERVLAVAGFAVGFPECEMHRRACFGGAQIRRGLEVRFHLRDRRIARREGA